VVVHTADDTAAVIRRVADDMYSLNDDQLIGTDCINVDPTQVYITYCRAM